MNHNPNNHNKNPVMSKPISNQSLCHDLPLISVNMLEKYLNSLVSGSHTCYMGSSLSERIHHILITESQFIFILSASH